MQTVSSRSGVYVILSLLVGSVIGYSVSVVMRSVNSATISSSRCVLRTSMRLLWAEHVIWTRNYIISALANLDDLKDVTERLLKNQADIGTALSMYYSPDVGTKFTDLLKEHILLAAKVINAAKTNNTAELAQENEKWYKNAQDISKFLSNLSPRFSYDMLVKMMNMHLKLLTDEVTARLQKKWKDDITVFDNTLNEILAMADYISTGIAEQFPEKF